MHILAPILAFFATILIIIPLTIASIAILFKYLKAKNQSGFPKSFYLTITGVVIGIIVVVALIWASTLEQKSLKQSLAFINLTSTHELKSEECHDVELRLECSRQYYTQLSIEESSKYILKILSDDGYTITTNSGSIGTPYPGWTAENKDKKIYIAYTELDREKNSDWQKANYNVRITIYK